MDAKEKKIIIVTGGAGFVGSHLCERLVKDGHRVISLDNYFTGLKENHVDGVEYREGHTKDIAKIITEVPDIIYHLGEYSRIAVSIDEPDLVFDFNMVGSFAVFEFWRKHGCKLVYAGSSTKIADKRSDGICGRDLSPYTWSKATNSDLVNNYGNWFNLSYAIVYFFNVYGPRELSGKYGTVVEIFKEKLHNNEPLPVRLPGTQKRRYTHVLDTVEGIVIAGECGEGDNYGIGSDIEYTTKGVADLFLCEQTMLPARLTSRPSSPVNSDKIKDCGWVEKYSLKDYVNEILENMN